MIFRSTRRSTDNLFMICGLAAASACLLAAAALTLLHVNTTWAGIIRVFGCHLPVLLGAWLLSGKRPAHPASRRPSSYRLLITAYLYLSSMIALGLLLGLFKSLTALGFLSFSGALGAIMIWIGRRNEAAVELNLSDKAVASLWKVLLLLLIILVAGRSLMQPDYDYDVLTYHLAFPAQWVQDQSISIIPTWCGDPAPSYSPLATEVYDISLILPMGSDPLARCGQFPFWLLLLAAACVLAREMRLSPGARIGGVLLLGLIPAITSQAATAMVDVAMAAHLVAVTVFCLRLIRRPTQTDAIFAALSVGLLLGTKYASLAFLLALLPILILAVTRSVRSCRHLLIHPAVLIACGLGLWVGGFWYARNLWLTGNPVYPVQVRIASTTLFKGAYGRAQMENSPFNVRRNNPRNALSETLWHAFHTLSGSEKIINRLGAPLPLGVGDGSRSSSSASRTNFDAFQTTPYVSDISSDYHRSIRGPFGLLSVLFIAGAIVMAFRSGSDRPRWCLYYLCVVAGFAVFWYGLPFQQPRFAWGPMALGLVGAAAVTRLHSRAAVGLLLVALFSYWQFFGSELINLFSLHWVVWVAVIVGGLLAYLAHRSRTFAGILPLAGTAFAWLFILFAVTSAPDPRVRAFSLPRWRYLGDAWSWIDHNIHDANVAYVGNNLPYFLAGRRFDNHVRYVPASRRPRGRFHEYANAANVIALGPPNTSEPVVDRYLMDPNIWLENLRRLQIDYVFVTQLLPNLLTTIRHDAAGFPIERQWLDALCQKRGTTPKHRNNSSGSSPAALPFAQRMDFSGGSARLYRLNWPRRGDLHLNFPIIRRDETDALGRQVQDHTPPGMSIRDYPLAGAIIKLYRLRALSPQEKSR